MKVITKPGPFIWSRTAKKSVEVSTAADNFGKRYSAFNARLGSYGERSIEEIYQCDPPPIGKGYDPGGTNWRLGKGQPSLSPTVTQDDLWASYLCLWWEWAFENTKHIEALCKEVVNNNYTITDRFAYGPVSQARALAVILNELYPDGAPQFKR